MNHRILVRSAKICHINTVAKHFGLNLDRFLAGMSSNVVEDLTDSELNTVINGITDELRRNPK